VFEVWWDGACGEGPNGKRQVYDWPRFREVVRRCQPDAVIFSDVGPGVRWVGNEGGIAGETCWSMISTDGYTPGAGGPPQDVLNHGLEGGTDWIPAECDVSIRPGWYYHAEQDGQVKSLAQLIAIWHASVGRNANLLLNLPVDRRGLVHENDAERLMELRRWLDATYAVDLAQGATVVASNTRGGDLKYSPAWVLGGEEGCYWATDDEVRDAWLRLDLPEPRVVDRIVLKEPIALGQRVKAFEVELRAGGAWSQVAQGTTIGHERILTFPGVSAEAVRVHVLDARACPLLSRVSLHRAPPEVTIAADATDFLESTTVHMSATLPGAEVRYTLDGSAPTRASSLYEGPVTVDATCTLRAAAFLGDQASHMPAEAQLKRWASDDLREASPRLLADGFTGLRLSTYEGTWTSLEEMAATPSGADAPIVSAIDLSRRPREEHFGLEFRGYLHVPTDGVYTFHLASDDGSDLRLDEQLLIDDDGLHGERELTGTVGLRAGLHSLGVRYFNASGAALLRLDWEGPGVARGPIAPEFLITI